MPILDPQIIENISQATQILWDTFGKEFLQNVLKRGKDELQWRRSVAKYYTSLYEYAGFVHVLGKMESEKLEDIFTDVNVLDKISAEQRYSLDHMREHFGSRAFRYGEKLQRLPGIDVLQAHNKLFILGKPGAGKTTFLKWAAIQAIQQKIDYFPIFVSLKTLSDGNPNLRTGDEVLDYIVRLCRVHQMPEPQQFIQRLLRQGKCIVLFDGLDEVNVENQQRDLLIDGLNEFVTQYGAGKVLITCRVAATDYSFTQFNYVEMADFTAEQIEAFIDKWFSDDAELATNCKKELLKDNQNEALLELAQIPLLLTLLCLTYEERLGFPPNRDEIYEEATRALLVKWDSSRKIQRDPAVYKELTLRHKQKLFASIAYKTFLAGDYFLPQKQLVRHIEAYLAGVPGVRDPEGAAVLQAIEAQHGIFVERARLIHSFSHLTLQEYYTACFIVANEARGSLATLIKHVDDIRWREVFLLVAGMLDDGDLFFKLFANALEKMGVADAGFYALLKSTENVRLQIVIDLSPMQARLLLVFWAIAYEVVNALKSIYHFIRNPEALDLARAFANALARSNALANANTRVRDFDSARVNANAFVLARALDRALDRNNALDRTNANALALANAFALDFASTIDFHGIFGIDIGDIVKRARLVAATMATASTHDELVAHSTEPLAHFEAAVTTVRATMQQQFQLPPDWEMTEASYQTLTRYLEATQFFLECLDLAYVADRQAWRDKLLLPT